MDQNVKTPSPLKTLLIGLLGALSALSPLFLTFTPGFFGHLLYTGGAGRFFAAFAVGVLGAYFLTGAGGLFAIACILLAAVLTSVMMKRRAAYFDTALFTAAAMTLPLYLMVSLNDLLTGAPAFSTIQTVFRELWREMITYMQASALEEAQVRLYEAAGNELAALLPIYMPAALCALGALFGLFNVLTAAHLNKRAHAGAKPMSKFLHWRLPTSFVMGSAVMAAGVLICYLFELPALDAIIPAVIAIVMLPFAVQGIALMYFLSRVRRSSAFGFAAFIVLAVLTFPASMPALAAGGVAEQLFHIRRRVLQRGAD